MALGAPAQRRGAAGGAPIRSACWLIGLTVGLAGGVGVGFAMRGMLFGMSPADPATLAGVAGLLVIVSLDRDGAARVARVAHRSGGRAEERVRQSDAGDTRRRIIAALSVHSSARRFVWLTGVLAATALVSAQQPTFRSGVRLVNVTVIAHDSSGRPVTNLAASDFHVFEDGKEQQIEVFAIETDRPVQTASAPLPPAPTSAPSIFTNRQPTRERRRRDRRPLRPPELELRRSEARARSDPAAAREGPAEGSHRVVRARVRHGHRAARFHQRREPADRAC